MRFLNIILPAAIVAVLSLQIPDAMAQISPLDFGLREAANGTDRFNVLYNTHTKALAIGAEVSYAGIDTLEIELPPDFKSIPLGPRTDFGGLVMYVTNNVRDDALFTMHNPNKAVKISKELVDEGDFRSVPALASGEQLLILTDQHPWTERIGHGHHVCRQDILWLKNGMAVNKPVAPWNTDSTDVRATFVTVDNAQKLFRGLTMHRTDSSTFKTFCLSVSGQCNVLIEDVHVTTPKSRMTADGVFRVLSSVCVTFRDVTVDGTYSGYGRWRQYGYAFSLYNLWNTRFERVKADGSWGVFGTSFLSNTTLEDCDINRFDIHCYGRDALLKRCTLRQKQTQFGSMYGTVTFDSCRFIDCIPVRVRSSYNAYTPFDIEMRDCTFELTMRYHSLVNILLQDTTLNPRPELRDKCWPNLRVSNMTVIAPGVVRSMNLYHPTGTLSELNKPVDYISEVTVSGLKVVRPNGKPTKIKINLSSKEFLTKQKLEVTLPDMDE